MTRDRIRSLIVGYVIKKTGPTIVSESEVYHLPCYRESTWVDLDEVKGTLCGLEMHDRSHWENLELFDVERVNISHSRLCEKCAECKNTAYPGTTLSIERRTPDLPTLSD